MVSALRLNLLGTPRILVNDQLQSNFATSKAQALLFYLAVMGQGGGGSSGPHSRERLATLLWGEMTDKKARQNLRTTLSDLRRLVGDRLLSDRQTVWFDPGRAFGLDVAELRNALALQPSEENLLVRQTAVSLYKGEFLSGFSVHNAPEFENWVLEQRQSLHLLVVQALFTLVNEYLNQSDFAAGLTANQQLLALEPWSEPVHRQQMLLLARQGQRSAALAQFDKCREILAEEFGVEPLPETAALYEQIKAGKMSGWQHDAPLIEVSQQPASPTALVLDNGLPQQLDFFGRQQELANLQKWVGREGCRLVGIFGIGGQGKSALATAFVHQVSAAQVGPADNGFQYIIWKSLVNAPPLAETMQAWVYQLSGQSVTGLPDSLDQQTALILDYLQRQRVLLVLDNLESLLQGEGKSGAFRPGYEDYGYLLRQLAEANHQSCLLFTSRERPYPIANLAEESPAVRFLALAGLPTAVGNQVLASRGLTGDSANLNRLVLQYSGNPLALKLVAETVQEIFQGNIGRFLQAEAAVFDDIRHVLDQQFARLSPIERELMLWLAVVREPISYPDLYALLAQPSTPRLTLEAMRSLRRQSLVELLEGGFGLQNVIMEYCTDLLIETMVGELVTAKSGAAEAITLSQFNQTALILAQSKEYVRASQTRLLLGPVAQQLITQFGVQAAEQTLQKLLTHLHSVAPVPGYAAANLLHLLLHLKVNLHGYDFSGLYFRQLYLRGVNLPQTDFSGAEIIDSVFTEPFGLVYSVAFSPDGRLLAAGMSEGDVYIWQVREQQLVSVLSGHQQAVDSVAFGQTTTAADEPQLLLASAGNDGRIGVHALAEQEVDEWHTFLTHPQHRKLMTVAVNGRIVTGVNTDGHVFVWDITDERNPSLTHQFSTAPTRFGLVAFSADGQTMVIGRRDGIVQFHDAQSGDRLLSFDTGLTALASLDLRQDGQLLAVGTKTGQIGLWRITKNGVHQIASEFTQKSAAAVDALAFSPNGKQLATTHGVGDQTVRIWSVDVDKGLTLVHTLSGHTLTIWAACFSPAVGASSENVVDERPLLATGSSDQTVRVWDLATGRSLYTQKGQPRALSAFAIRKNPQALPDASAANGRWLLAAAGYDQLVHLWQGDGVHTMVPTRVLSRAKMALYAVAVSDDGRFLASGGHGGIVYLWELATGRLLRTFRGHSKSIYYVDFHPSGKLLVSGSPDGTICLWSIQPHEPQASQPVAVIPAHPDIFYDAALSEDGRFLATVGTDLHLRLWDLTQDNNPEQTELRKTVSEPAEQDMVSVAFSPDGTKVAAGGSRVIHVWDVFSPEPAHILRQHTSSIFGLAFDPGGQLLVSGGADCTICLWDLSLGKMRRKIHGHEDTIYEVAFTPDGAFVLSCGFDGTIKFWDVQTGEYVTTVHVEGPYADMHITGISGITQAQRAALSALGAVAE